MNTRRILHRCGWRGRPESELSLAGPRRRALTAIANDAASERKNNQRIAIISSQRHFAPALRAFNADRLHSRQIDGDRDYTRFSRGTLLVEPMCWWAICLQLSCSTDRPAISRSHPKRRGTSYNESAILRHRAADCRKESRRIWGHPLTPTPCRDQVSVTFEIASPTRRLKYTLSA